MHETFVTFSDNSQVETERLNKPIVSVNEPNDSLQRLKECLTVALKHLVHYHANEPVIFRSVPVRFNYLFLLLLVLGRSCFGGGLLTTPIPEPPVASISSIIPRDYNKMKQHIVIIISYGSMNFKNMKTYPCNW